MKFSQLKKKLNTSNQVLTTIQKKNLKGGNGNDSLPTDDTTGIGTVDTVDL